MKLSRKTNIALATLVCVTAVHATVRGILGFDLTPQDVSFWLIPAFFAVLIIAFFWRQASPLAYVKNGKVVVRGQEIDDESLEYWFYRKDPHNSHEIVLKYPGYRHHHIVLPEHDETLEGDRVVDFLRSHLRAPERPELSEASET